jgi:hypothetical protein
MSQFSGRRHLVGFYHSTEYRSYQRNHQWNFHFPNWRYSARCRFQRPSRRVRHDLGCPRRCGRNVLIAYDSTPISFSFQLFHPIDILQRRLLCGHGLFATLFSLMLPQRLPGHPGRQLQPSFTLCVMRRTVYPLFSTSIH